MNLKKFLNEIKNYPENFEVVIHTFDNDGNFHVEPIKGITIMVSDKKLSIGAKSVEEMEYKELKKRGFFKFEKKGSYDHLIKDH